MAATVTLGAVVDALVAHDAAAAAHFADLYGPDARTGSLAAVEARFETYTRTGGALGYAIAVWTKRHADRLRAEFRKQGE